MKQKIKEILEWSQKYAKADMRYILKNVSWVTFGQAINSVLSVFLLIGFANLLPKETFGIYRYILSISGILNVFTLTGMNNAVARAVAQGNEGVLRPAVAYQLKWNMLMFAASLLLSGYYFFRGDLVFACSLLILGIFVPLTFAFNTYSSYLEGKKEFGLANVLGVIATFVYSIGVLVSLFFTKDVLILVLVYAFATFIPSFVLYLYTLRKFKLPASENIDDTLKYGRELTYLRFIDPIVGQLDKIILGSFWGAGHLATYALATAIPNRAVLSMKSWVAVGFPKFSEKTPEQINTIFYRRIIQGMAVGSVIAFAYILVAPYLFAYFLPQYLESVLYSQILGIGFIFALPNRYMSLLFTSQGFSRVLFKRTIFMSITNALLYIVLGLWGGILGLIIAHLLSTLIGFVVNILMWQSTSKVQRDSNL